MVRRCSGVNRDGRPIWPPAARTFACAAFTLALKISVGARRTCWVCEYLHVVEIPGLFADENRVSLMGVVEDLGELPLPPRTPPRDGLLNEVDFPKMASPKNRRNFLR
jgi:hypothetical protein